jgi:CHAT domain
LSESVFNGVAQNLIGKGIPAVVAMSYSISVGAASAFAEAFYHSLGQKESLAIAFHRTQSVMGIEGNQWYRPVLYLRWEDNEEGQLFKTAVETQPPILVQPPETQPPGNAENEYYKKRLAAKQESLAKVQAELDETDNLDKEGKLEKKAQRLLKEIQELEAKLK